MKTKSKPKPTITRREASRLVAEAGATAYEQAGASGGDPKAIKALLDADRVDIVANMKVRPLMLETFLVLEELGRTKVHQEAQGTLRQAMTLFTYVNPRDARQYFTGNEKRFPQMVMNWAGEITSDDFNALSELVLKHLTDFYGAAPAEDSAKKKQRQARSKSGPKT